MQTINILTNNSAPNSRAFNAPLIVAKRKFKHKGFNLRFYFSISDKLFESDILFINSNFFRAYWQSEHKVQIFDLLDKAKQHNQKIIWFDTTDSTWCTQFEVLPYVDHFLKNQLLCNKSLYLKTFKTGRIYTDVFNDLYNVQEKDVNYPPALEEHLYKVSLSWNTCFENYTKSRYSWGAKIHNRTDIFLMNFLQKSFNIDYVAPNKNRNIDVSCKVGVSHSRPSVIAHRKFIIELLQKRQVSTAKVTLSQFFNELQNAKMALAPFGVGEITLRDFEIIICGATLLKPDMSHLDTWPNLYQSDKTYVPHKWDLSDLDKKIDNLLDNQDSCIEIAENAQKIYKKALSDDGMEEFADRLIKIIT